eukprot:TRINITY_DN19483_c0_g1_i1.p1 TRINITY_DN19483_c0_g1~~TRINITY_DN19483_c0_g1_i1.p1  ORF type:complete len:504 (+),score=105.77 TRINITY_DN19483_c0_g1_i1:90-1514(+)
MAATILEIRAELKAVRESLNSGSVYRGRTLDGPLQDYFLDLHDKEKCWLAEQLATNGTVQPAAKPEAKVELRPCPQPPPAFDRDDVASVLAHLHACEASPQESGRGLRALTSLAYSSTAKVLADPSAIPQALKLMEAHSDNEVVQFGAVGTFCNCAFDAGAATGLLSEPAVLVRLVASVGRTGPNCKATNAKAVEALARIVGIAASQDDNGDSTAESSSVPIKQLRNLFKVVVEHGDCSFPKKLVPICEQLILNEVVTPAGVAKACIDSLADCVATPAAALCWFELVNCLSGDKTVTGDQQAALVNAGSIRCAIGLMSATLSDPLVQMAGIECCSTLVGVFWEALNLFASAAGARQIEVALLEHPGHAALQGKGLKSLGSCPAWPSDMQIKSGYSWGNAIIIAKKALARFPEDQELQTTAIETLNKNLEHLPCVQEVAKDNGAELVKAAMEKFPQESAPKLHMFARKVLKHLGK